MEAEKKYCATTSLGTNPLALNGMVTTPHHLATQAGLSILRKGGNAVDAGSTDHRRQHGAHAGRWTVRGRREER